ncbi:MAG: DUF349 domain-containing protein [Microscillaceae bacterium]|nr:DUF349 domain-containing protein [Microscillaceae bacterium]
MEITTNEHEFGYVREEKIYLKGFLGFPDRQIGQVKETQEASIKYFEDRFQIAKQKVLDLERLIEEAQNKGSYLMKLVHMRKYLSNFDGLGDYTTLFAKLDELEKKLRTLIAVNRVKNLEIKEALLVEAQQAFDFDNMNEGADHLKEVKLKWIKTGAVIKEKHEEIEALFVRICEDFYDMKKSLIRERSQSARDNARAYRIILREAEEIKSSDDFEASFEKFKTLQQNWKKAGKIPHRKAVQLWEKFKETNDYFFNRYKKYKSYKEIHPEMTAQEIRGKYQKELMEEAESLVDYDGFPNTERAKELLMEWKKLSGTFRFLEKGERFRIACDKIFELSYLMRVVTRKYPNIDTKPMLDKLRIKTSFMRELIRREENELGLTESKMIRMGKKKMPPMAQNKAFKTMQNNFNIQKRKIKVKKEILDHMDNELNKLRK